MPVATMPTQTSVRPLPGIASKRKNLSLSSILDYSMGFPGKNIVQIFTFAWLLLPVKYYIPD